MNDRRMTGRAAARRAMAAAGLALALAACGQAGLSARADADPVEAPAAPTSALGSYLAARHAQQQRDYARAAEYMSRALADDPDNNDLVRRTFVLRVSEGRIDDAAPLAQRIVALDRNAGLAQIVLLLREAKSGDFAAAVQRARLLPSDGAQRLSAPLLIAWSEVGLQHRTQALQALDALNDVRGVQTLRDLHAAMIDDFTDQIGEADEAYKKLLAGQAQPTWRAVEVAGNFYERHQRSEEARRLYDGLAASDQGMAVVAPALQRIARGDVPPRLIASPQEGMAEALFDLASILDQRETLDASLIYARLALDLRPNFPLAQMLVAEINEDQKHTADALAVYRSIDAKSTLAWTARLRAALALDALDRTDDAAGELKRLAAERPHDPEPLVELGDILRGRSRFGDAVAAYDQAIARVDHPEPRHWRLYYSRAVALERSGQWPRAEADLRRALELQPEQPLVLNYLGYSWIDKGQNLESALKMIQRAVELRPNDGYIVDSLGWAYYRLGDFGNATQILEHAIELLPEDPTVNDHLGDAYWQSGRVAEARFQWRRALQFKPEADEIKTIETKLDHGPAVKPPSGTSTRGG
ncbi:MAG TPA: tetratricopeptide repeat protein [Stellaceae bacterium]|nr:tetratricopeptide repeat protein [Stellaceae bacterium]